MIRGIAVVVIGILATACVDAGPNDVDYRAGREIFGTCAACHGKQGEGGAGPALTNVLVTFPDCDTHRKWVGLGSARWKEEVGPTYGSANSEIKGAMPAFAASLTPEQIQQVALYERVRFGESDLGTERTACGLD